MGLKKNELHDLFEQVPSPLEVKNFCAVDGAACVAVPMGALQRLNAWLVAVRAVRVSGPVEFQLGFKWSAVTADGVLGVMVEIGRVPKDGKEPVGDTWSGVYCDPKRFIELIGAAIKESEVVWPGTFTMKKAPSVSDPDGSKVH